MFTAFIYINAQVTFVRKQFVNHILNRQQAAEMAAGRKLAFKSIEH